MDNCDCDRCEKPIEGKVFVTDAESTVDLICYVKDGIDCLTTNKQRKEIKTYLDSQIKENE